MKKRTVVGMSAPRWFWTALFLNYIFLQILDAIITIIAIQSGKGVEINGVFKTLTSQYSLYTAMCIKVIVVIIVMYIVYRMNEGYHQKGTTYTYFGVQIKATTVIHFGLLMINLTYYLIILNGLIVLLYPSLAPLKSG